MATPLYLTGLTSSNIFKISHGLGRGVGGKTQRVKFGETIYLTKNCYTSWVEQAGTFHEESASHWIYIYATIYMHCITECLNTLKQKQTPKLRQWYCKHAWIWSNMSGHVQCHHICAQWCLTDIHTNLISICYDQILFMCCDDP
jgi:hypothetical protein